MKTFWNKNAWGKRRMSFIQRERKTERAREREREIDRDIHTHIYTHTSDARKPEADQVI